MSRFSGFYNRISDEVRRAPALEGGQPFAYSTSSSSVGDRRLDDGGTAQNLLTDALRAYSQQSFTSDDSSKFFQSIRNNRFYVSFFSGVTAGILVQLGLLSNVVIPWFILFFTFEITSLFQSRRDTNVHPSVASLTSFGVNGKLLSHLSCIMDIFANLSSDSSAALLAFLIVHFGIRIATMLFQNMRDVRV
ncbi:hypothetical protein AB6A40_011166 [Gnathostoma spinigerum]|uniref:PRA1 family protein n=1 Tax=Gnathostoma spinigerum TaxID=75299 RepID=A0ABD6F412_9BILA